MRAPPLRLALTLIACATGLLWSSGAWAQPLHCVRTYLAQASEAPQTTLGIARADAERIVMEFGAANGATEQLPRVVPCNTIEKVQAFAPASDYPGVPRGAYIIFNPDWVREVVGNNETEATFLFGHELAHHWRGHLRQGSEISQLDAETEADEMGGCAVARLHADFVAMQGLIVRIRREEDSTGYPNQAASLEAARAGFRRCGGDPDAPTQAFFRTAGPTLLGASLIAESEGLALEPYIDPSGYLTVGYGHLISRERWTAGSLPIALQAVPPIEIYGTTIRFDRPLTQAEALFLLHADMERVSSALNRLVTVPLSGPQRAALESFVYSAGVTNFERSTLRRLINEREFDLVPNQLARWVMAGGQRLSGLQRRRDREIGMWLAGSTPSATAPTEPEPSPQP